MILYSYFQVQKMLEILKYSTCLANLINSHSRKVKLSVPPELSNVMQRTEKVRSESKKEHKLCKAAKPK